jgi:hypothetical protein
MLAKAMMDVTDRSIPAVISTTVCPVATTINGNIADSTLPKFRDEANPGTKGAITAQYAKHNSSVSQPD